MRNALWLDSELVIRATTSGKVIKAGDATDPGEKISLSQLCNGKLGMPAIVPGTVLNSLVHNQNTRSLIMESIIRLNLN